MNVASLSFLLFGLAVAVIYNLAPALRWRQAVLLIANLAFLTTFSTIPSTWIPYVAFLVLGYVSYLLVRRNARGAFLPLLIAVLIAYFWLKKYVFLPPGTFLSFPYVTLGLSYVLFRLLHLLIDTKDGLIQEEISPVTFLNYILNFTAIISGPIQLYQQYAASQLRPQREPLDVFVIGEAVQRIIWGYFKISITGVVFQTLQERALAGLPGTAAASLSTRAVTSAVIGAAYPLYLYCNFSGYTDMVIGMAKGIRLTLPENFDRPFASTNFLDFWGHWHISLSSWLKTYVYSPLLKTLMKRVPNPDVAPYLGVVSYFVTFFLIGVWHGRTTVFVFFGILQGLGVAVTKLYQVRMIKALGRKGYRALSEKGWYNAVARGLTFTYFGFSLIWFWSNWSQMDFMLQSLHSGAIALGWFLVFVVATALLSAYEWLRQRVISIRWRNTPIVLSRYTRTVWDTALVVIMAVVLNALSAPAPDIVYKAF